MHRLQEHENVNWTINVKYVINGFNYAVEIVLICYAHSKIKCARDGHYN